MTRRSTSNNRRRRRDAITSKSSNDNNRSRRRMRSRGGGSQATAGATTTTTRETMTHAPTRGNILPGAAERDGQLRDRKFRTPNCACPSSNRRQIRRRSRAFGPRLRDRWCVQVRERRVRVRDVGQVPVGVEHDGLSGWRLRKNQSSGQDFRFFSPQPPPGPRGTTHAPPRPVLTPPGRPPRPRAKNII